MRPTRVVGAGRSTSTLAAVLAGVLLVCLFASAFAASCVTRGDEPVDLAQLNAKDPAYYKSGTADSGLEVFFQICGASVDATVNPEMASCGTATSLGFAVVKNASDGSWDCTALGAADPEVVALTTGDAPGYVVQTKDLWVKVLCDDQADSVQIAGDPVYAEDTGLFTVAVSSKAVCVTPSSGHSSVLFIFFVFFLLALGVYCGVGIAWKRRTLGVSGIEAIPNVEFWRSIPAYMNALWHATLARFRNQSEYTPLA
eukprot:tig00020538_g10375.t1